MYAFVLGCGFHSAKQLSLCSRMKMQACTKSNISLFKILKSRRMISSCLLLSSTLKREEYNCTLSKKLRSLYVCCSLAAAGRCRIRLRLLSLLTPEIMGATRIKKSCGLEFCKKDGNQVRLFPSHKLHWPKKKER